MRVVAREFDFSRFLGSITCALGALSMCGVEARGEGPILPLANGPTAFEETFLDAPPPTSRGERLGVSVVGVRLSGPTRKFDPGAVRALLGAGENVQPFLCVRFISRDGRYSARARYKLAANADPAPSLEMRTEYSQQLRGYSFDDIAIVASSSKTCENSRDGSYFAVAPGIAVTSRLVVSIDGDARVQAQLRQNDKAIAPPVVCSLLDGARVGFTQECRLDLPAGLASGTYQLSIGETAVTGEIIVKTRPLVLYRGAQTK